MIKMNFLKLDDKARLGPGMIKGVIVSLILLTVFVSILPDLIPQAAVSVNALATNYTDTTIYGTGASAIGAKVGSWTSYFWVLGPFILIIGIIMRLFMGK